MPTDCYSLHVLILSKTWNLTNLILFGLFFQYSFIAFQNGFDYVKINAEDDMVEKYKSHIIKDVNAS